MIENLEWLTRNTLRSFPIKEDAPVVALNTGWTLPNFLLADASLVVPEAEQGLYVSAVTISSRIISVIIASVKTGASLALATTTQGIDAPYARVAVQPLTEGVSGYVSFGSALSEETFAILQKAPGMHVFHPGVLLEAKAYLETGLFPVRSLSLVGMSKIHGETILDASSALEIAVSEGEDNGDPLTFLTLNLTDPTRFLSPCEVSTTPCECPQMPIHSINGVTGDEDGRITIEIVDENGKIYLLGPETLSLSITRTGIELCSRPVMPDEHGRLPSQSGDFTQDAKPETSYKNPADSTFPNPLL